MLTVLFLVTLFPNHGSWSEQHRDLSPAHFDGGPIADCGRHWMSDTWWVRDYVRYSQGEGFSSYAPSRDGTAFVVNMNRVPPGWGEPPAIEAPTYRDALNGAGFGLVILLMVVVPLGSAVVFLRPPGLSWWRGSPRVRRAEVREILGRL